MGHQQPAEPRGPGGDEPRPQTVEQAIRQAHQLLATRGVTLGTAKITRLCRDYVTTAPPCALSTFLVRNAAPHLGTPIPARRNEIEWDDPTGEIVAFHADQGRTALGDVYARDARSGVIR